MDPSGKTNPVLFRDSHQPQPADFFPAEVTTTSVYSGIFVIRLMQPAKKEKQES
jgi:hypothetical protein